MPSTFTQPNVSYTTEGVVRLEALPTSLTGLDELNSILTLIVLWKSIIVKRQVFIPLSSSWEHFVPVTLALQHFDSS